MGDVDKGTPPEPLLPGDLAHNPSIWKEQGHLFRTNALCSVDLRRKGIAESCRSNKIALINALSDDEWACLYHYGFVPINTKRSYPGYIRLHYRGGNNASLFDARGRASTGKCCFILTACQDANFLSQLLELRTRPERFVETACSSSSVESRLDPDYEHRLMNKRLPLMTKMSKKPMVIYSEDERDERQPSLADRLRAIAVRP